MTVVHLIDYLIIAINNNTAGATEPPAVAAEQTSPHKDKKITGLESGKDKSLTPAKKDDLMEAEDMAAVEHFDEVQISDIVVLVSFFSFIITVYLLYVVFWGNGLIFKLFTFLWSADYSSVMVFLYAQ